MVNKLIIIFLTNHHQQTSALLHDNNIAVLVELFNPRHPTPVKSNHLGFRLFFSTALIKYLYIFMNNWYCDNFYNYNFKKLFIVIVFF